MIVGNGEILCQDPIWHTWLKQIQQWGCIDGITPTLSKAINEAKSEILDSALELETEEELELKRVEAGRSQTLTIGWRDFE